MACLSQLDETNTESPISFMSNKLSNTQSNWSAIEREAYAVIAALPKFSHIVFGQKILLFCDHNPLQYLTDCAAKSSKLTRWSLSLARYDIVIQHVPGRDNVVADFLSRCSFG